MATSDVGQTASRHSVDSASEGLCSHIPCRVIFILMGFFCCFNLYAMRVNLGVTMVSMVNNTYLRELEEESLQNETMTLDSVVCDDDSDPEADSYDGSFKWSPQEQSLIKTCFYAGYSGTQLAGGVLAEKFGGKVVLFNGIAWTSVLTILTPVIAEAGGFPAMATIQYFEGFAQGFMFPAMHVMLANWVPTPERGRMVTFVYSGAAAGAVVSYSVSGVLCSSVSWQSDFYVIGSVGLLWCLMWIFLIYDKPSLHPRITSREREYIERTQGPQRNRADISTPWLAIITSPPVYAIAMGNFAFNWGNFYLITVMPNFLSHILKFNTKQSGFVASTPFFGMFFGMVLSGFAADLLISRRLASVTGVRKLFAVLGFVIPAGCMIGIGFVECEKEVAVFLLAVAGFCLGLSWGGWGVNHLDLAPLFAGTLFGFSNTFGAIPGYVAPLIVHALTEKHQTHAAWRNAFYISAGGLVFGTLVSLVFVSGKRQKWSDPEPKPSVNAPAPAESKKSVQPSISEAARKSSAKKSTNTL